MKAFDKNGNTITVELIGERIIYKDGKPFNGRYADLTLSEQRYFDRVCDDLYDLPIFNGNYIYSRYNVFEARHMALPIKKWEAAAKLYRKLRRSVEHMAHDIATDDLTENKGRDGKNYWWYLDMNSTVNAAINIESGEIITDRERIEALFC